MCGYRVETRLVALSLYLQIALSMAALVSNFTFIMTAMTGHLIYVKQS